ncbi:MAG: tetratricopeptide repeat protein [Sphingobacteriaceae bacterium]|nr:tetratricopeptide repeat protein [Sphingobacteriaceae bacterium]
MTFFRNISALFMSLCFLLSTQSKAGSSLDSLYALLTSAKADTARAVLFYKISNAETQDSLILEYALKAKELGEKLILSNNEKEVTIGKNVLANSFHNIGFVEMNRGNPDLGLTYMNKSLFYFTAANNKWGMGMALNNTGYIYHNQGLLDKALENYLKSIKYREEAHDDEGLAFSLNNVGYIYYNLNENEKTLYYYKKALLIRKRGNNKSALATSLHNLGYMYQEIALKRNKKDSTLIILNTALNFYNQALSLRRAVNDKMGIALSYNIIAFVYDKKANSFSNIDSINWYKNQALQFYQVALSIREEISDKNGEANSLSNIAMIYYDLKQLNEAKRYGEKAYTIATQIGFPAAIQTSARALYNIYKKSGKYKEALEMHEQFKRVADTLNGVSVQRSIAKKQAQYDFEKKLEMAKNEQDKKDILAAEERYEQQIIRNFLFAGLLVVLVFTFIIFKSYLNKRKANVLILQQKKDVEMAKLTIEKQKDLIELKQKEVVDSIRYAKRIQQAQMANENYISKILQRLKNKI